MPYPEFSSWFGCLCAGFVVGHGHVRKRWMRGGFVTLFFTPNEVPLDSRFVVFLREGLLLAWARKKMVDAGTGWRLVVMIICVSLN